MNFIKHYGCYDKLLSNDEWKVVKIKPPFLLVCYNQYCMNQKWLEWAVELQSLAQTGLTYGKDVYDHERYERIRQISAEMIAYKTEIPLEKAKDLFCNETGYQTPKLDTRAAIFKDNKILLVQESNGTWSMPGGCQSFR